MLRPLLPAWRDTKRRHFLGIFILSIAAIALFHSTWLIPGQHTNLAIAGDNVARSLRLCDLC